jgi:hypothetical protein
MRRGATRASAIAVLALVAIAGAGIGIAVERLVLRPPRPDSFGRPPFPRGGGGPPGFGRGMRGGGMRDRLERELDLTPEQVKRLDAITDQQMADFRTLRQEMQPRFDSLLTRTQHQLDSVLTPEQREKLKTLRERDLLGAPGAFGPPRERERGRGGSDGPRR